MTSETGAVIDAAIREQHVVEVDYADRPGAELRILAEPYGYRENRSGQVVVVIWDVDRERYEELVVERLRGARDLGIRFEPRGDRPIAGPAPA